MSSLAKIDISYRNIRRVTVPVLVGQISNTLVGIIDTIMVGRLGVAALAGVGLGNFIALWPLVFLLGMLSGVSILVAQAMGARRPGAAGVAYWQGFYLALLLASVLAACWTLVPLLIGLTGASPEVSRIAIPYMQVRLLGGFGLGLLTVNEGFYRGLGRTGVLTGCGFAQLVLNVGLNYVLIFGALGVPGLGAVGAAWGTLIAQGTVGLFLMATLMGPRWLRRFGASEVPQVRHARRFDWPVFKTLVRLSLPTGLQYFMSMGGVAVFIAVVARLGDDEMAATNAVIQAWSLTFMAGVALSVGATILVGQCVGAEAPDDARLAVRRVIRLGYGLSLLMSMVYVAIPEKLMALFVLEADQQRLLPFARPLFLIVVASLMFDCVFQILSGALMGSGDTRYPMWVNIGSSWLFFVPMTLIVAPQFGLIGAWCCLVFHHALKALCMHLRVRGQAWLRPPLVPALGTP